MKAFHFQPHDQKQSTDAGRCRASDRPVRSALPTWPRDHHIHFRQKHFTAGLFAFAGEFGMDIAKQITKLHTVNPETSEVERHKLKCSQVLEFFVRREPALVAIGACSGTHLWAHKLVQQGHEMRLLHPKTCAHWCSATKPMRPTPVPFGRQQPEAPEVAVKTEVQQSVLALHRMRAELVKFRIMQTSALRGLLYEFGIVLPEGHTALLKALPDTLAALDTQLPDILLDCQHEQWARVQQMQVEIDRIERRLASVLRDSPQCQQIAEIPGVGLLTATAAVAAMGEASSFKSGREFAARTDSQAARHRW